MPVLCIFNEAMGNRDGEPNQRIRPELHRQYFVVPLKATSRKDLQIDGQGRSTAATLLANNVLSTSNDLSLIVCVKRTARRRFGRETLT